MTTCVFPRSSRPLISAAVFVSVETGGGGSELRRGEGGGGGEPEQRAAAGDLHQLW